MASSPSFLREVTYSSSDDKSTKHKPTNNKSSSQQSPDPTPLHKLFAAKTRTEYVVGGFIKESQGLFPGQSPFYTIPPSIIHIILIFYQDTTNNKICIGDEVRIWTLNHKLRNEKGSVMYIGYPYGIEKGIRYGINLDSAKGDFDGTKSFNVKTGEFIKSGKSIIFRRGKDIKQRKFFKTKKNRAIFVKLEEISNINHKTTLSTRFTIEDEVEVRFRGIGRIKFIGNLEHTKEMGIWYGIQLNDRRGRHDGTVNGVKYFECKPQYGLHCRENHLKIPTSPKTLPQKSDKWNKIMGAFNTVHTFAVDSTATGHSKTDSNSISSSQAYSDAIVLDETL